jgi:tRNA wybutosine-synthesizing protein 1
MKPVTQLYISVDAATKDSLKKIDRPIFVDFWERFIGSIDALSKKGQRTVFRLTLIKEWNMEEIKNYSELAERGRPSFIEIKGVTYCGSSKASTLTIKNVPFHEEVLRFSKELIAANKFLSENYEVACEHEHSCCVLIADKRFKVNNEWHTWIDYTKFHELAQAGNPFNAFDYMAKTPSWAVAGSEEKGFDPEEIRFKRNKPYQGSGC